MGKPTDEELALAIKAAKIMREKGLDTMFVAKALLNCHYRMGYLMEVMKLSDEYLRSGLSEQVHMKLERAIQKAKEAENQAGAQEAEVLGL